MIAATRAEMLDGSVLCMYPVGQAMCIAWVYVWYGRLSLGS
jgi:hypothetical protein